MEIVPPTLINSSDPPPGLGGYYFRPLPFDDPHSPWTVGSDKYRMETEDKSSVDSIQQEWKFALIRADLFNVLKSLNLSYAAIEKRWGAVIDMIAQKRLKNACIEAENPVIKAILNDDVEGLHKWMEETCNVIPAFSRSSKLVYRGISVPETAFNRQKQPTINIQVHLAGNDELNRDVWIHIPTMAQDNFNQQKAPNGADVTIEIPDGNHDQSGKNTMLESNASSWANNYKYKSASSSRGTELNYDGWTRITPMARDNLNEHKTSNGADAIDDDRASPVMPDVGHRENNIETEFNNNILGITGQAAISLVSGSSDSPFLHVCAAATGVGFLGSFFANYALKRPKIARILSKIGSIGAASAVIIASGMHFPIDTKWNLDVMAIAIACLITAVVVATS